MRRIVVATACAIFALATAPAIAEVLPLPVPAAPELLPNLGATADRLRASVLPAGATSRDDEVVRVGLGGTGLPTSVAVDQHISLTGQGDYVVVERGPARRAEVLGAGDPPTLKAGAVLYAGFLPPTGRLLAARLTLDPAYEQARLPMTVALAFRAAGTRTASPLGTDGRVPGPGVVSIGLVNATGTLVTLASGDAPAAAVAGPLEALRTAAMDPGLPRVIAGASGVTETVVQVTAPLRVTGTVRFTDLRSRALLPAYLMGDGTIQNPGGGHLAGVLTDGASFQLSVRAAGRVSLDLRAVAALDPRTLLPPAPSASWRAWAATHPDATIRRASVDRLELAAAQSAQIRVASPYLTTGLTGAGTTSFDYRLATTTVGTAVLVAPLRVRPGALVVIAVAAGLVLLDLELLRRRL